MSRQVPTGPDSQMPVQPTRGREMAGLPEDTSQPFNVTVPGPAAEYGSLTQAQAEDARKMETFRQQQSVLTDKMNEQQDAMTRRALAVDAQRQAAQRQKLETEYKLKRDLLEPKERLAADKQRSQYKQALLAQLGHAPSDEEVAWADAKAGEMVIGLADATLGQRKASAEASKATAQNRLAQIKHWNAQDAHAIRMESITGMSAASARQFNMDTREIWPELSRVKSEIIRLQTMKSALGSTNTTFDAQLEDLEDQRDQLQLRIQDARDQLKSSSVPTAPQGGGRSQGKYNVDLQKFGLAP